MQKLIYSGNFLNQAVNQGVSSADTERRRQQKEGNKRNC